jgi:hypothetical protein
MHVGVTGARIKGSAGAVRTRMRRCAAMPMPEAYCVSLREIGANNDDGKSAA